MARYDLYVTGQVFFERAEFRSLTGGLASNDCANLGCLRRIQVRYTSLGHWGMGPRRTWTVLCHNPVNNSGFYTVQDEIANSGNKMAIGENGDQRLL